MAVGHWADIVHCWAWAAVKARTEQSRDFVPSAQSPRDWWVDFGSELVQLAQLQRAVIGRLRVR